MPDYRCYFMDDQNHIREVEALFDCPDDAEAMRLADALLAARAYHHAAEVWDRERKVSRHVRQS